MKGLLKYLSPFAPDQSGAVSVLYSFGGVIVIADAGGCTGNICGFDEPRWFHSKSAVLSAGLRDMDAILGRDDRLVDKLKDAVDCTGGNFAAVIGTPVPAVIATDMRALKRMASKKCGIPVMTVECTGTFLYDKGAEASWMELFKAFTDDEKCVGDPAKKSLGVLGLTPLDTGKLDASSLKPYYMAQGYEEVLCYGMGDGIDAVRIAGSVSKNIVIAPSGLKVAEYLKKKYGTPYEIEYPLLKPELENEINADQNSRVLIVHQQVSASELRRKLRAQGVDNVTVGTWFMELDELKEEGDVHFEREEEFIEYVTEGGYDIVVADPMFRRALRGFSGRFVDMPHFAVSGIPE